MQSKLLSTVPMRLDALPTVLSVLWTITILYVCVADMSLWSCYGKKLYRYVDVKCYNQ